HELGGALAGRWLARVAAGEAIALVGHEANPFVTDAHLADLLLLARGDELHAVEAAAVRLVHQPANDPGRRLYAVEWQAREADVVARGPVAEQLLAGALDRGALACAAQALGVAERLLELAVAYASQREQFGRPI